MSNVKFSYEGKTWIEKTNSTSYRSFEQKEDLRYGVTVNIYGNAISVQWWFNGKFHRGGNKPAFVMYDTTNHSDYKSFETFDIEQFIKNPTLESVMMVYEVDGLPHREDGPAYVDWEILSDSKRERDALWYFHGKDVTDGVNTLVECGMIDTNNMTKEDWVLVTLYNTK